MNTALTIPAAPLIPVSQVREEALAFLPIASSVNKTITSEEDAVALGMYARDLRIPISIGLIKIFLTGGRPAPMGSIKLGLCLRTGELSKLKVDWIGEKGQPTFGCQVTVERTFRKTGVKLESSWTFTWADAWEADLLEVGEDGRILKDNWRKYPRNMLFWRAAGLALEMPFEDVLMGMYTPDELGADFISDDDKIVNEADGSIDVPFVIVDDEDDIDTTIGVANAARASFERLWAEGTAAGIKVGEVWEEIQKTDDDLDDQYWTFVRRIAHSIESPF